MTALLTLIAAIASYAVSVAIVIGKLGMGEGAVGWILLAAAPFAMICVLAAVFRNRRSASWLIFVGTLVCAIDGVQGIYAAFYSDRPHDPWIVMFRPIFQVGVVGVVALIATAIYFIRKKTPNQMPEPTPGGVAHR